jgi:hypothetical protein
MAFYEHKMRYRCIVTDQGLGKSQEKQTPFFYIKFEPQAVITGPDTEERVQSYERNMQRYLTEKTLDYAISDLEALGIMVDAPSQIDLSHPKTFSIVGQTVEMYCQIEEKDGKQFEKWSVGRKPGSVTFEPIAKDDAKLLDNLFGASLKTRRKMSEAEKPKAMTVPRADSAMLDDDETPF